MTFNTYKDVNEFYHLTYDVLMRHESQNMIILGNLIMGYEGKDKYDWRDPANWFMAAVTDASGSDVKLTALMTPPHKLVIYATDNQIDDTALSCLIDGLDGYDIPGIHAEKNLAERFVEIYAKRYNVEYEPEKNMRVYELNHVNPGIPETGKLRHATEADIYYLPYWQECFWAECFNKSIEISSDIEKYLHTIPNTYVLEDYNGTPVSVARSHRKMSTVCAVGFVYTPPYIRGKGYATDCVAQLSKLLLEKGYKGVSLYTDLANPTSNSIYMKIGYNPIADVADIKFQKLK